MSKLDFTVVAHKEDTKLFGLSGQSNDKTQAKDIPALSKKYYEIAGKSRDEILPFFVVSSDYDEKSKDFRLFVGGEVECSGLEPLIIRKGIYGKATVKPKMGFMWGLSIGEVKRAFYTKWLPQSEYMPLNMEYEYHTEKSKGKDPSIDIFFAINATSIE